MRQVLRGLRSGRTRTEEAGVAGRRRGPTRRSRWLPGAAFLAVALVVVLVPSIGLAANPSANLDQCGNGAAPSPSNDGCDTSATQWENGNLGTSKSVYFEGDSIPYRLTFGSLSTSASHAVTIQWDTTKGSKHAIDYIDNFNQSVLNANPCLGVSGCNAATPNTRSIPADPQVTGAGVTPISGAFSLYGGTITSITRPAKVGNTTCTNANSAGSYCYATGTGFTGDKTAAVTINFTTSVANPVLAWGGHIATRHDWGLTGSAVSISGSPYHTRLIDLDGAGGNQDRSLSAAAVIFPGFIHIVKNTTGGDATFGYTASPSPLSSCSITTSGGTGGGPGAANCFFDNITNFQTYSVAENTPTSPWSFDSVGCTVDSPNGGSQTPNQITRSASINLAEGEEVTCTYANHFVATPGLTVDKTSTDTTFDSVGDVLNYSYLVTNTGNVPLTNIIVTDDNIDDPPGMDCPSTTIAVGHDMTCTATHTVTQADLDACKVINNVSVTSNEASGGDSLEIDGTCTPHLAITKDFSPADYSAVGDVISYTIVATNDGNVTLHNVSVTDPNASGLSCTPTIPVTNLAPDAQINCTASHTVTQADLDAGHYANQACVNDGAGGADQACDDVDTPGSPNPHLAITKDFSPADYSAVGDVISYTIVATNDGNVTLHNVSVTDPNASGLSCTPTIPVTNLAPDAQINCTASHTVTQADLDAGHYANQACVNDGAGGADQACDDVDTPGTQSPDITIDKASTTTLVTTAGQVVPYTYLVTNTGNVTLTGITVTDDKVATVTCPKTTLVPAESMTCNGSHTVTSAELGAGGNLTNIAEACGNPPTGSAVCDDDTVSIPIQAARTGQITPTNTTCSQFNSGSAKTLDAIQYSVKSGKISQVNPGVFFYYIKVTASAGSNTFVITQSITTGNFGSNFFAPASGSNVYTSNCTTVGGVTITQSGATTTIRFNASSAGTYIIGQKYNSGAVVGKTAPSPTTVHYTFEMGGVSGSLQGLDLVKK
jgi:uncharacterized repeat protein (TIGR01451 family)